MHTWAIKQTFPVYLYLCILNIHFFWHLSCKYELTLDYILFCFQDFPSYFAHYFGKMETMLQELQTWGEYSSNMAVISIKVERKTLLWPFMKVDLCAYLIALGSELLNKFFCLQAQTCDGIHLSLIDMFVLQTKLSLFNWMSHIRNSILFQISVLANIS